MSDEDGKKKKAMDTIIKLIEKVSEKELDELKEKKNIEDIAKTHTDAFERIFDEITENYKNNYKTYLKTSGSDTRTFEYEPDNFDNAMEIFKDVKIKENIEEKDKKKVLDLFEAILDFYKDDDDFSNNLKTQVDEIKKELKDGTKDKSKVIFEGDRCYRITDGENDSVNVRFMGLCDKKEERDEVSGGRKRKSRKRRRKSKRKLRRKNRKSERKNRKSRRKSIKR
jgi:hypothetical protein